MSSSPDRKQLESRNLLIKNENGICHTCRSWEKNCTPPLVTTQPPSPSLYSSHRRFDSILFIARNWLCQNSLAPLRIVSINERESRALSCFGRTTSFGCHQIAWNRSRTIYQVVEKIYQWRHELFGFCATCISPNTPKKNSKSLLILFTHFEFRLRIS